MSSFFLPPKGDRKRKKAQSNVRWALIRNVKSFFVKKKKTMGVPQKQQKKKKMPADNEEIASDSEVEE